MVWCMADLARGVSIAKFFQLGYNLYENFERSIVVLIAILSTNDAASNPPLYKHAQELIRPFAPRKMIYFEWIRMIKRC